MDKGQKFIIRMFDRFDGWIDITKPIPEEEADAEFNKRTKNGTEHTKFRDGHYYAKFKADTRMLVTPETLGR